MPQMNKGGKFIFGKSVIQSDGTVQLPPQAVEEYRSARRIHQIQGPRLLLDAHLRRRANSPDRRNDDLSGSKARHGAAQHPKQRHRIHNGRKGPAAGEGGTL